MKFQRSFRISLLLCWMISMLLTTVMQVKAEQIEKTVEDQTIETRPGNEIIQIEDITGLDAEFEALEEESVLIVEEVERYRKEAKRNMIQRIVVIMLAVAILGVGVITGLQEKKKNAPIVTKREENKAEKDTGGQT